MAQIKFESGITTITCNALIRFLSISLIATRILELSIVNLTGIVIDKRIPNKMTQEGLRKFKCIYIALFRMGIIMSTRS